MIKPEIILTSDGSHTLSVEDIHETYHSVHGAISESRHVYLNNGYKYTITNYTKLNVFLSHV